MEANPEVVKLMIEKKVLEVEVKRLQGTLDDIQTMLDRQIGFTAPLANPDNGPDNTTKYKVFIKDFLFYQDSYADEMEDPICYWQDLVDRARELQ